jgi:putative FmdB family regulatory protein
LHLSFRRRWTGCKEASYQLTNPTTQGLSKDLPRVEQLETQIMPIYEYICKNCGKKVTIFQRQHGEKSDAACPACSHSGLTRIVSCFAVHKSVSTINEESGEPCAVQSPNYYKDPRNIGRHLETKFRAMNVEMPSKIQDSIKAAREGLLPNSIKDLENASSDSAYH